MSEHLRDARDTVSLVARADAARSAANQLLDPSRRSAMGQFLTPGPIAEFMASMFRPTTKPVRLLDAGAGVGSLTAAFVSPVLAQYAFACVGRPISCHLGSIGFPYQLIEEDDPVEAMRIRLAVNGEGDELIASTTLRFARGTTGAAHVRDAIRDGFEVLSEERRLRKTSKLLAVTQDGNDIVLEVPLGGPRQTIATVQHAVFEITALAMAEHERR